MRPHSEGQQLGGLALLTCHKGAVGGLFENAESLKCALRYVANAKARQAVILAPIRCCLGFCVKVVILLKTENRITHTDG